MEILNTILIIAGLGAIIYLQLKKTPEDQSEQKIQELKLEQQKELSQIENELKNQKSETDRLSGQGKELFVQITNLKNDNKNLQHENDQLKTQVAKHQAEEAKKQSDFDQKISKLEESRNALEQERMRIRKQDEERKELAVKERDRIWNEHEQNVLNTLNELTATPELNFKTYDNNNLPEGFSGRVKPDFMIEVLDSYVVFDAKSSRSENLQNYLSSQVKSTAEKLAKQSNIYGSVFFIVPTEAIKNLKKLNYYEGGFNFFIVSPEAIAPILASFKKIEAYEFTEKLSPEEREDIVNLIAELSQQINFSNAVNLLLTQRGVLSLQKIKDIKPEFHEQIEQKQQKMRLKSFTPTDLKQLMSGTHVQQQAIREQIAPKAGVEEADLNQAKNLLED